MVKNLASGPVYFGLIPHDHWYQPDWIDEQKAEAARNELVEKGVIYGGTSHSDIVVHILLSSRRQCLISQYVSFQLWGTLALAWHYRLCLMRIFASSSSIAIRYCNSSNGIGE